MFFSISEAFVSHSMSKRRLQELNSMLSGTESPTQDTYYLLLVQPLTSKSNYSSHIINIAEIEAYHKNGTKLTLHVDSYSSQMEDHPVSDTIDGTSDNSGNFGHTANNPVNLTVDNWFKYTISGISKFCSLGEVIVYNRVGCCLRYRIVGNYLQILKNSFVLETFTFTRMKKEYNFTICNTTGLC